MLFLLIFAVALNALSVYYNCRKWKQTGQKTIRTNLIFASVLLLVVILTLLDVVGVA